MLDFGWLGVPEDSEENTGNGEDDDDYMDNSDEQPLHAHVMETLLTSLARENI